MRYLVTVGSETLELEVERGADGNYRVSGAGGPDLSVALEAYTSGSLDLRVDGRNLTVQPEGEVRLGLTRYSARAESVLERAAARAGASDGGESNRLVASMPGRIVRVLCEPGSVVVSGTPLIVIEAMKMQNELCAKRDAVVRAVRVSVDQTVERGALLIELE